MTCEALWCFVMLCDGLRSFVMLSDALWGLVMLCDALWCCVRPCDAVWCLVIPCEALCCCVMPCDALWCCVMPCAVVWGLVMPCDAVRGLVMQSEALCCCVRPCDVVWGLVIQCDTLWNYGDVVWCRDTQCVSLLRPAMSCDKVLGPYLLCRCWLRNRRSDNNWVTPPLVCVGCAVWCVIDHKFHAVITLFLNRAWYRLPSKCHFTQKPGNSSIFYHKTKNPLEAKICVNKSF